MAKRAEKPIPDLLEGYSKEDPESLSKVEARVQEYLKLAFLEMGPTQERFVRVKNHRGRMPRTRLFEGANQSGKSTIGVAEDIAHAMGFRPWLSKDDPDYKIPIRVPNVGMIGCEVAGQTLAQNIEPKFMELVPNYCSPQPTRYSDGSLKSMTLTYDFNGNYCGSTIHFRSYVQQADTFEGVVFDWLHWDEPPPRPILNAAERGKMRTNAPSWLTMTPLKEPYIYDIFTLKAFNNGGDDDEIAIFRCSVWENCQDWCRNCNLMIPENDPDKLEPGQVRPKSRCPNCNKVMGFMPRAGIENYLKKITDPDEREAREEGKWKHLSGLIYKELDRSVHLYKDFEIPQDWMRIEVIDPHDRKPTRWLFGAVSPEEITINGKSANRIYWYTYLLLSGNIDKIAQAVKVRRAENRYREPAFVIIDAKFGAAHKPSHGIEQTSWQEELEKSGINHIILSHSSPGDIGLGHKRVKEYLAPHYSPVKDKTFPGMLFALEGCSGDRGPTQDMWNYQWDKDKPESPDEAYKDFCDCVRYAALEQPAYRRPEPEIDMELAKMLINKDNHDVSSNPLYYGLSMKR